MVSLSDPPLPLHKYCNPYTQSYIGNHPSVPRPYNPESCEENVTKPQEKHKPNQVYDYDPPYLEANVLKRDEKVVYCYKETGDSDDFEQVECSQIVLSKQSEEDIPENDNKHNRWNEYRIGCHKVPERALPQVDSMTAFNEEGGAHRIGDDENDVPDREGDIIESGILRTEEVHDNDRHNVRRDIEEKISKIVKR